MEEKKVTKKISEDVSIDYYFLNTEKVMNCLKIPPRLWVYLSLRNSDKKRNRNLLKIFKEVWFFN
jgi:hypothetical protein